MNPVITPFLKIIVEDSKKVLKRSSFSGFRNKSILITGASGLIGTYLLACLYHVLNSGKIRLKVNILIHSDLPEFILPLVKLLQISVYQGDITDRQFVKSLPKAS